MLINLVRGMNYAFKVIGVEIKHCHLSKFMGQFGATIEKTTSLFPSIMICNKYVISYINKN